MKLLPACFTHSAYAAGYPVGVLVIEWVSAFTVSLARHVVRSVRDAVSLVVPIGAYPQVFGGVVVSRSIRPVTNLQSFRYGSSVKGSPYQSVHELPCEPSVHCQRDHAVTLLVLRGQNLPLAEIRASTVSRMDSVILGANPPLTRRLVVREPRNGSPFFVHIDNYTCMNVVGGEQAGRQARNQLLSLMS